MSTPYEATYLRNSYPNNSYVFSYLGFTAPPTCAVGSTVVLTAEGTTFEGQPLELHNTFAATWTVGDHPEVICPTGSGSSFWQKSYNGLLRTNTNYSSNWVYEYYVAARAGEPLLWTHYYSYPNPSTTLANRYQVVTVPTGFAFGGYPQGVTGNVFKDCAGTALEPLTTRAPHITQFVSSCPHAGPIGRPPQAEFHRALDVVGKVFASITEPPS